MSIWFRIIPNVSTIIYIWGGLISKWIELCIVSFFSAVFVKEEDIATYTMKGVDDPRTLNKTLFMRPPANTLSFNELVSLWEKKIGKTLEKTYILEDQLLENIQGKTNTFQHPKVRYWYQNIILTVLFQYSLSL